VIDMGFMDNLVKFWGKKKKSTGLAESLVGHTPIFSQFGTDIYASDVVQQAISCIVQEIKKLNPTHIREIDMDVAPVNDSRQRVLQSPTPFMTTSDFLEKITWLLFFNYNVFIYPTYYTWEDQETGKEKIIYTGLYPLQPTQVDFLQDVSGELYTKLWFANAYNVTLPYNRLIHIRKNYSVNDYMGGNQFGQPDNDTLLSTLQINDDLLKGIAKAMRASYQVNGVVKYNTMLDKDGSMEEAIKDFDKKLQNSESGFLPADLRAEITSFNRKIQMVDADTLKFIDEKILRTFGVPLCILTGDYTKAQYEAFYQKTLEPLIIAYSQAFTKTLFTDKERSYGNKIMFYPKDLIFMSTKETLEMVRLLGDSGTLYENEKRVSFGLRPLPELVGKRMQSLNYVDVDLAPQYQIQRKNNQGGKTGNEEE